MGKENDGGCRQENVQMILPESVWEKVYEDGSLLYEGFTVDHKAFGPGRCFFPDGRVHMDGIFGVKGFICGRIYYPNGLVRFEGCFRVNHAYGPNFPEFGTWYGDDGELRYHGMFSVSCSSLGWPKVITPEGFGSVPAARLKEHLFMWDDSRKYMEEEGMQEKGEFRNDRQE